jgi:uncharacterized protein (TIGR03435 family)
MYRSTLQVYLYLAYNLPPYRIEGPSWIGSDSDIYDMVATMPENTPDDQVRLMLQNLLAERFHLQVHWNEKETEIYAIVVGKNGPNLKVSEEGVLGYTRPGLDRLTATAMRLDSLAGVLMRWADRPVVNMTGLNERYDLDLRWNRDSTAPVQEGLHPAMSDSRVNVASVFASLKTVGLKVEPRKARLKFLVVDHAEKTPVEN